MFKNKDVPILLFKWHWLETFTSPFAISIFWLIQTSYIVFFMRYLCRQVLQNLLKFYTCVSSKLQNVRVRKMSADTDGRGHIIHGHKLSDTKCFHLEGNFLKFVTRAFSLCKQHFGMNIRRDFKVASKALGNFMKI